MDQIIVALGGLVATVITVVGGFLIKYLKNLLDGLSEDKMYQEALDNLLEGMAKAQSEFVREAKLSSDDGKLSQDEINHAQHIAYKHALEISTGPVLDLLSSWGKDRIDSVIKQLLSEVSK